jgi:type III pantothenate kinase
MLIACDIGNSYIKSALFKKDKLTNFNLCKDFSHTFQLLRRTEVKEIAVASVVPSKLILLKKKLSEDYSIKPFVIDRKKKFSLSINYTTPETLGMDRICSAEGAYYLFTLQPAAKNVIPGDCILSIDCGTATTVNVIQYPNNFVGGVIAPGLDMMFASLSSNTAQLPSVSPKDFKAVLGNSTKTAIASGVINSISGMINQVVSDLPKTPKKIYITGGNARFVLPLLKFEVIHEKALVLYGIKAIYDRNRN